jgi:peptidyl-prolyl cis-trans isomerase SurA
MTRRSMAVLLTMGLAAAPALAQLQVRSAATSAPVLIRSPGFAGDYIVAVVNSDLVTAAEVEQRVERVRAGMARGGSTPPPAEQIRQQVLDALIEERVLVTHARDSGAKVDDAEIDRAVQSVAAQNKLTLPQLRERLRASAPTCATRS